VEPGGVAAARVDRVAIEGAAVDIDLFVVVAEAKSAAGQSRGERRALLGADHRGKVWKPFQGFHLGDAE
jgi:hypothetical protein